MEKFENGEHGSLMMRGLPYLVHTQREGGGAGAGVVPNGYVRKGGYVESELITPKCIQGGLKKNTNFAYVLHDSPLMNMPSMLFIH